MKKWWVIIVCSTLIFVCVFYLSLSAEKQRSGNEPEPPPIHTVDPPDRDEDEAPNKRRPQQIVTFEPHGDKVEIEFETFENDWLSIYYDTSLQALEDENKVTFYDTNRGLSFSIEKTETALNFESDVRSTKIENGYDYHGNRETPWGIGHLFYYYDELYYHNRHSIDVFMSTIAGQSYYIEFKCPYQYEETYPGIFEYMLDTIEFG